MTNLVPIDQAAANMPLAMRQRMQQGLATTKNFQEGVRDAFPLLSIKAKIFRVRMSGQETPFIDPTTRQPIQILDVVMVDASRTLAKTYYIKGYSEGDLNPPDCWSLDSIRPDPSVANKVSPTCVNCPMNAFGSKITDAGKAAKACQDARRVAVVMPHMLGQPEPMIMMLRVPQSSLKNLKNYAQALERHGIDPTGVITRLSFDFAPEVSFPKLMFNFVNILDEGNYNRVLELSSGPMVQAMLVAPDFDNAPTTPSIQNPQTGPVLQGQVGAPPPILEDPNVGIHGAAAAPQVQTPPAMGTSTPVTGTTPVQQAPVTQQATLTQATDPGSVIELPDGRYYDQATKQFVAKPEPPKVEAQLDPQVIELPGGQWFNMHTKKYVTGPELGAPEVTTAPAAAAAATRKRTTKPKDQPAQQQGQPPAAVQQAAAGAQDPQQQAAAAMAAEAARQAQPGPVDNGQKPNGNGSGDAHAGAQVSAAPQALEQILGKLLPGNQQ